jgi:ABC-type Fe3+ transport system permease subunit
LREERSRFLDARYDHAGLKMIVSSGGWKRMMTVYLEKGNWNMKRNSILIGGAVAGAIAIVCALAFATRIKRSEKRK